VPVFRLTQGADYNADNSVELTPERTSNALFTTDGHFRMAVNNNGAFGFIDSEFYRNFITGFPGYRDVFYKIRLEGEQTVDHTTGGLLIDFSDTSTRATFFGGSFGDRLVGSQGNDTIAGENGDDIINGGLGSDHLIGGNGDDTLRTGVSQGDRLDGGAGDDTLLGNGRTTVLNGGAGMDRIVGSDTDVLDYSLESGTNGVRISLFDGFGWDTFNDMDTFEGIRNVRGSDFGDRLAGDRGRNELSGQNGDDLLVGLEGDDTLTGGRGSDALRGDDGDDLFVFDVRKDAGTGADKRDLVVDFTHDDDQIVLESNGRLQWTNRKQLDADFSGQQGEVRYDDGLLQVDVDGDGKADFEVKIQGTFTRSDAEFLF
jgi:Ca2+-binding RTX toxin-like protein